MIGSFIRTIIFLITFTVIAGGTFLMVKWSLKEEWSKPCDKYGRYSISNIPSRCYKYFVDQDGN